MSKVITQIMLDNACSNLKAAVLNPYAVARYLAKPKQAEQQWKDIAKKMGVTYAY